MTHIQATLASVSCVLSMLGAMSILLSYAMFPTMRNKAGRQLLVYLSLADLLSAASYLWASLAEFTHQSTWCQVQAVLSMYFPIASFLWTDCVAVFIWLLVTSRTKPRFSVFHAICWGIPAVLVTFVAAFGMEGFFQEGGTTGGWCWIRSGPYTEGPLWLWILIGGKSVEWASIAFTAFFYVDIFRSYKKRLSMFRRAWYVTSSSSLRHNNNNNNNNAMAELDNDAAAASSAVTHRSTAATLDGSPRPRSQFTWKLIAVPIVFFAGRLFGNINIVRTLIEERGHALDWLDLCQAAFDPSQGFFNAIMFVVFSEEVRSLFWDASRTCCTRAARWVYRMCFRCDMCRQYDDVHYQPPLEGQHLLYGSQDVDTYAGVASSGDAADRL